jgi:hypothetical protein
MLVGNLTVPSAGARAMAASQTVDACGLFTVEEASKVTGRSFIRARLDKEAEGTTCTLTGATGSNIGVTLSPAPVKKVSDDFRKLLADQGEKTESVSGLGDDAYFWGNRIYVRARNQLLVITSLDVRQAEAKARVEILALARLGVPQLK